MFRTENQLVYDTIRAALDLYISMTSDMLTSYKDSEVDLEEVIRDVEMYPMAQQLLDELLEA